MTIHIAPEILAAFETHLNEVVDWDRLGRDILRRETAPFFDNPRHGFLEFAAGWQASRQQALEEAAKAVEALRDDHCASTQVDANPEFHCYAKSPECEFVVAWNDAATAIRSLAYAEQAKGNPAPTKGPAP